MSDYVRHAGAPACLAYCRSAAPIGAVEGFVHALLVMGLQCPGGQRRVAPYRQRQATRLQFTYAHVDFVQNAHFNAAATATCYRVAATRCRNEPCHNATWKASS
jgi:hypothetical protein